MEKEIGELMLFANKLVKEHREQGVEIIKLKLEVKLLEAKLKFCKADLKAAKRELQKYTEISCDALHSMPQEKTHIS